MAEAEEEAEPVEDHHGEPGQVEGRALLAQRLHGVRGGQQAEEEAGAEEADQVQAALQDLQDLAQHGLVGPTHELGDQHEDKKSYSRVVHRLLRRVNFREEFDDKNGGGDRAEESSGEGLALGEEGEESPASGQLEDVAQVTVDVDEAAGASQHRAQQQHDQQDGGVEDEVEAKADQDDEDGEAEGQEEKEN